MSVSQLLVQCTRLDPRAQDGPRLAELAAGVSDWDTLLAEAERHGMAPLLYRHLRAAQVALPEPVARALQGLYVAHRHANRVRSHALGRVLQGYAAAGIEALVVKGGALCHMLYPEPALRPMSDLDLLVRRQDLESATQILRELGMSAPQPPAGPGDKSLPTAGCVSEGVWVGFELHYDLFEAGFPASMTMDDLQGAPLTFALSTGGPVARTLGLEDLLWHLCEHLRFHAAVFTPWRLIWVADILGVVERYGARMDWAAVERRHPGVFRTLSLLEQLRPLAIEAGPALQARLPAPRDRGCRGVGADFDGWPRHSLAAQRDKGWARILADTWAPPEWWLRLRHGLDAAAPAWRVRWIEHPREMLGWLRHFWQHRNGRAHRTETRPSTKGAWRGDQPR